MIMVYYYFPFLGCVNSQNLLNAMKKTFSYKIISFTPKGPQNKKKKLTQKSGKTWDEDNLRKYL
jgi:hypothetical protein